MEINPKHTGGVRGSVWCDENMMKAMNEGGKVASLLPQLPDIRPTYAIWYMSEF